MMFGKPVTARMFVEAEGEVYLTLAFLLDMERQQVSATWCPGQQEAPSYHMGSPQGRSENSSIFVQIKSQFAMTDKRNQ